MGAHVFIVNSETFQITRDRCVAAVVKEKREGGKFVEKTRADILADISCVRIGDRIFFYEVKRGFHGIYEAVSLPFVDEQEVEGGGGSGKYLFGSKKNPHFIEDSLILPNRVLIKPKIYFKNPVTEMKAFGRFISAIDLRSIFYKKVLGRGKSVTHLFPEEEVKLTELLLKANNGKTKKAKELKCSPYKPKNPRPVIFDLQPTENGEVKYEKILEGWLTQNIDNPSAGTELFLGDLKEIECFANYVPITIAGGNLDLVVFHQKQGRRYKITIIELKKGKIVAKDVKQVETYVKWATENLTQVLDEKPNKVEIDLLNRREMIQPVVIGSGINSAALERLKGYSLKSKPILAVKYKIENKSIKFELVDF
ncbi:hypothetical protein DRN50_08705 [Thermococci archaeon]|nr:MAG: hypothetical protein DRN50_08705 [Thermococci archaeon]